MFEGGPSDHATFEGRHAHVRGAINVPKPIQRPRIPVMVGGNGPEVTWRLAARHADELNLDGMSPDEVAEAMPVIHSRCEEIGRDPASLRISVHLWWGRGGQDGQGASGARRIDELGRFRELGVHRVMELVRHSATSDDALERYAEDARAAGASLASA
jgi:alkanesulfonate monooxygenase SsuD/methylene tetrahydromethanopterin reductase-like flavin-dependent oxidoreductase (luciferase family)